MSRVQGIIFGVVLVIVIAIVWVITSIASAPRPHDWRVTLDPNSMEPYGTNIFRSLLEDAWPHTSFDISKSNLPKHLPNDTGYVYCYVGSYPYLLEETEDSLLTWVENGNTLFMSTFELPAIVEAEFPLYDCFIPSVTLSFTDNPVSAEIPSTLVSLEYTYLVEQMAPPVEWTYFYLSEQCQQTDSVEVLGTLNTTYPNFIRYPYGNGYIVLHSSPELFTNLYLVEERYLAYAESVLQLLNARKIIWDESSRLPSYNEEEDRYTQYPGPMQFLLSQPAFRWAWYVMLVAVLLFIMLKAKRLRAPMPIFHLPSNTSLRFVETVGQLYHQRESYPALIHKLYRYWLLDLRRTYGLKVQEGDNPVEQVARKTNHSTALIAEIFRQGNDYLKRTQLNEHHLQSFHQLIQQFYHDRT